MSASQPSFPGDLWDSFKIVCDRLREGKSFCHIFIKFFADQSKLTKEFAKNLSQITKSRGEEKGTSINFAWLGLCQEVENISNIFLKLSDEITYRVETPILTSLKESEKVKRKGKETGEKLIEALNESVKIMLTARQEYEKSMKSLDQSQAEFDRVSHLNEIAITQKAKKKFEQDKKKTESNESKYRKTVDKAKALEAKMYDTELPKILSDFEMIERQRLGVVKTSMLSFANAYLDHTPQIIESCNRIKREAETASPDEDVDGWIIATRTGKTKDSQRIEYEPYNPQYKKCCREGGLERSFSTPQAYYSPSVSSAMVDNEMARGRSGTTKTSGSSPPSSPAPSAPAAGYCRGLFDYDATQPAELSFKKGDMITVLEKDPSGWWKGELNGQVGFFPSVEWVEEVSGPPSSSGFPVSSSAPSVSQNGMPPKLEPPSPILRCRAMYDLAATNPNELNLKSGEILFIESEADGWYYGSTEGGQKGIFPASFVEIVS